MDLHGNSPGASRVGITRRTALALGASFIATSGRSSAQSGLTRIRVASNPVSDVAPLLHAQQAGLFRASGLTVVLQQTSSGSVVASSLAGHAIDIGKVSSVSVVTAHAHGIPMKIIFPDRLHTFGPQSQTKLIVKPDSPIRRGRDLNGKTIAVSAVKDSTWIGARLFIDADGGDSSTARFVEVPFSAVGAAVVAERIDAGVDNDPYLTRDVASGKVRALGDLLAGIGTRFVETAWVAMEDYIEKNRETVDRFVQAIREAQAWCNTHVSASDDLASALTGIDRAEIAAIKTVFATEATPSDMQPYVTACARYGVISSDFASADLYMSN